MQGSGNLKLLHLLDINIYFAIRKFELLFTQIVKKAQQSVYSIVLVSAYLKNLDSING